MAADAGLVQGSVGAALRFVRENLRFVAITAAIFAVASTAIAALSMLGQTLSIVAMVGIGLAQTRLRGVPGCSSIRRAGCARALEHGWLARLVSDGSDRAFPLHRHDRADHPGEHRVGCGADGSIRG